MVFLQQRKYTLKIVLFINKQICILFFIDIYRISIYNNI